MTVLPHLERELLDAHGRRARRGRIARWWLAIREQPPRAAIAGSAAPRRSRAVGRLTIVPVVFSVAVTVIVAVFALTAFHPGHSATGGSGGRVGPATGSGKQLLRAQAQKLYGPVAAFERSTTSAQRAAAQEAPTTTGHRIDSCQRPYQNRLFSGRVGTDAEKIHSIYDHGTLLETYQAREAVVAPQLEAVVHAWAGMRLSSPVLQQLARGLVTEISASLHAHPFNSCAFVAAIARHHFSLAWTENSAAGRAANRFWAQVLAGGNSANAGFTLVQAKNLLSADELVRLTAIPGVVS